MWTLLLFLYFLPALLVMLEFKIPFEEASQLPQLEDLQNELKITYFCMVFLPFINLIVTFYILWSYVCEILRPD